MYFSDFAAVCDQSTDFHFPDLGRQLLAMERALGKANAVRTERQLQQQQDGDSLSVHSVHSIGSNNSANSDSQVKSLLLLSGTFDKASLSFSTKRFTSTLTREK